MNLNSASTSRHRVPKDAVLLIPETERPGAKAPYAIAPGYYDKKQLLELLKKHKDDRDAISFIADMLETGELEKDGFADLLRKNCGDRAAITRIIKNCALD